MIDMLSCWPGMMAGGLLIGRNKEGFILLPHSPPLLGSVATTVAVAMGLKEKITL